MPTIFIIKLYRLVIAAQQPNLHSTSRNNKHSICKQLRALRNQLHEQNVKPSKHSEKAITVHV